MNIKTKNQSADNTGTIKYKSYLFPVLFAFLLLGLQACNYEEIPDDLIVSPALSASFSVQGGQLWQGCSIGFSVDSLSANGSYFWEFGDNQTSTEESPEHSYNNPGTYTVSLTVSDGMDQKTETQSLLIYQTNKFENIRNLGSNDEGYHEVLITQEGDYLVVGTTRSIGAGNADIYLIKTTSSGALIWEKTLGDSGYEFASDIIAADNGYLVLGYSGGFVDLIKIDPNGNVLWEKNYPNSGDNNGESIIQTSDGGYAIAGRATQNFTYNMALLKVDANGNLQWTKNYGDNGDDIAYSLVETSDGGFILAGYNESAAALVKIDESGNLQWEKTLSQVGTYGAFHSIQPALDGGYIVCGSQSDISGDLFAYVAKVNESGTIIWDKSFGGTYSAFYDVEIASDNGYVFSGKHDDQPAGNSKAYLVKTDANGVLEWEKQFQGINAEARSVTKTTDCGYIAVGNANGACYQIKTDSQGDSN